MYKISHSLCSMRRYAMRSSPIQVRRIVSSIAKRRNLRRLLPMRGRGFWDSLRQIPQSKNIGYDIHCMSYPIKMTDRLLCLLTKSAILWRYKQIHISSNSDEEE